MNLFDLISVSAVHQRAVQIEKQLAQRSGGSLLTIVSSSIGGISRVTGSSGRSQRAPPTVTPTNKASTSGVRCFSYGETGHRQTNYKKQSKKALFVDREDYEEEDAYMGEKPIFDGTDDGD